MRKLLEYLVDFLGIEQSYYIERDCSKITRVGRFAKLDV